MRPDRDPLNSTAGTSEAPYVRAFFFCALVTAALAGCSGGGVSVPSPHAGSATATPAPAVTATLAPGATATPTPIPTNTPTPTPTPTATPVPTATPTATPPPTPTPVPTIISNYEVPYVSDALADSIGMNDHIATNYTASDFATVVSLEQALGIRHLRDGIINANSGYDAAVNQVLNGTSAKIDGLTLCSGLNSNSAAITTAGSIQAFNSAIGNRVEAVEGPNEVDSQGDANWPTDTKQCLPGLRGALAVPFIAPSLSDPADDANTLGDISSLVDAGNAHRYFNARNPDTSGYGGTGSCGVYGALSWALCLAQVNSGSKTVVITETGWNSQSEVDEPTQAKYLSRLFLVNYKAGVLHSYIYDLKDYSSSVDAFYADGLIRTNDSTKPAYDAVKNEIAYFQDPGASFSPQLLHYQLTNASLDHALFQRRDGTYLLALWNEAASWNTSTNSENTIAPQNATVDLEYPPIALAVESLTDAGTFAKVTPTVSGAAITLPIDDHVTFLSFRQY